MKILTPFKKLGSFCKRFALRIARPLLFLLGYVVLFIGVFKEYHVIRVVTHNTALLFTQAPTDLTSPNLAPKGALVSLVSRNFGESKYSESLNTLFTPVSLFNREILWVIALAALGYFLIHWTSPLRYARLPLVGKHFTLNLDSTRERYWWWACRWAGYLLIGYMLAQLVYLLTY